MFVGFFNKVILDQCLGKKEIPNIYPMPSQIQKNLKNLCLKCKITIMLTIVKPFKKHCD